MDLRPDPMPEQMPQHPVVPRLTITYYVEPQNLRTFSVSVRRANAAIVAVLGALIWSAASGAYFIGKGVAGTEPMPPAFNATALNEVPAAPLAPAVLCPEAKNVEKSEPPQVVQQEEPKSEAESAGVAKPDAPEPEADKSEPDTVKVAMQEMTVTAPEPAAVEATVAEPAPTLTSERFGLEEQTFRYEKGKLRVRFKLKNKVQGAEVKGRVWGIATYDSRSGQRFIVTSAPGIDVNRPEDRANGAMGVSYRAKVLTSKELSFAVPHTGVEADAGHFTEVRLMVSEDGATPVLTSRYPLDERGQSIR